MERVKYYKSDKVLFQQAYPSHLKCILAPMMEEKKTILCLSLGVGGYARSLFIGNQKISPASAGMTLFLLSKFHGEESKVLFEDKDVAFSWGVEESYSYFKVICPKEKALSLVAPLLSLTDHFDIDNDEVEKAKAEYLSAIKDKKNALADEVRTLLYKNSAMKEDPYGDEEAVKAVHLSSVKKFYSQFFDPSYLTLYVLGNMLPSDLDKACQSFVFHRHSEESAEVRPFKEDYQTTAEKIRNANYQGQFVIAVKFPARKDLFEKFGAEMFSDYELIQQLFLTKALKENSFASHAKLIKQGQIHQGGEDAFFYQEYQVEDPKQFKADMEAALDNKKLFGYFTYRAFRKEFLARKQSLYKKDPEAYLCLLQEGLANSFAEPSITDQAYKKSLYKFKQFLEAFKAFPRAYIY